jgi:hypothetical protein
MLHASPAAANPAAVNARSWINRAFATAACALLSAPALAQTPPAAPPTPPAVYTPTSLEAEPGLPRTAEGRPDFQGEVWAVNFFPVFEATPLAATLVVTDEQAAKMLATMMAGMRKFPGFDLDPEAEDLLTGGEGLPLVRGERRSRLVVLPADGKLPIAPDAKPRLTGTNAITGAKDSYEQRPVGERCLMLSGGPPNYATVPYNRLRFIQTPDHVVIHNENGDEARIIPFADAHAAEGFETWYGDSIARWEGDTLVIETLRQKSRARLRGLTSNFLVDANARVIERFTRLSKTELLYQFTVEDPTVYTAPWLAEYSYYTTDTGMYPSPCHEHNYSLTHILLGQRVADAKAAKTP